MKSDKQGGVSVFVTRTRQTSFLSRYRPSLDNNTEHVHHRWVLFPILGVEFTGIHH